MSGRDLTGRTVKLVLLLIAATVVAGAVVGQAVFAAWGLDFLSLAGPADVAMVGLPVVLGAVPGVALLAGGLVAWQGRGPVAAALCLAGLAALYGLVVRPAMGAAQHGFHGRADWVIDGGTGGCATAKVLWTGRDAVVYQCVAAGPRRFRVSFDRGSMTLLPASQVKDLVNRM